MKRLLPHTIFLISAILVYVYAQELDSQGSGRDFIRLEGMLIYVYWVGLLSYGLACLLVVLAIKRIRGEWHWGISYLLALGVAPILFLAILQILAIFSVF